MNTKSVGGIVVNQFQEVLIVNQKGVTWSLPKGHVEGTETALQTAYREIEEETGLTSLIHLGYLGHYTRPKIGKNGEDDTSEIKNIHFYLFTTPQFNTQSHDPDNPEAKWVSFQEASSLLSHPLDIQFFKDQIPLLQSVNSQLLTIETTTATKEEAENIANTLVSEKAAACCQISGPITSVYEWENKLEKSTEYTCHIKTTVNNYKTVETLIKKHHSYDCPQILATPTLLSHPEYGNWVKNNTL